MSIWKVGIKVGKSAVAELWRLGVFVELQAWDHTPGRENLRVVQNRTQNLKNTLFVIFVSVRAATARCKVYFLVRSERQPEACGVRSPRALRIG